MPAKNQDEPVPIFTDREKTILALLVQGKSNREIADALGLTHGTVRGYISEMLEKAKVHNRLELALRVKELQIDLTRGTLLLMP